MLQRITVVVLTITRIIKSVVTGKAPVTLEWNWSNTQEKKKKLKKGGKFPVGWHFPW